MKSDPRNPLYLLLLLASVAFVVTALSYALPMHMLPPWFQAHGWKLLLAEVAAVLGLGLASMGLDRVRQVRRQESRIGNQESGSEPSPSQETVGE